MKNEELLKLEEISTKQIKLIMRRLNAGQKLDLTHFWDNEVKVIDSEQGIKYLLNQWKTPKGKERLNSPFGYREEAILEGFTHFEFMGEYHAGNFNYDYYIPVYRVCSKDDCFEYHMQGGKVNIVG